jgi:hypothetical protein
VRKSDVNKEKLTQQEEKTMNKIKVENMTSSRGNTIANQFIINDGLCEYFQSYNTIIARRCCCPEKDLNKIYSTILLDRNKWDYSTTTGKYRNQFLGETTKETQAKIDSGEYILTDLN